MAEEQEKLRDIYPFLKRQRAVPKGVNVDSVINLARYLPFRIHRLAIRVGFVGEGTSGAAFDPATTNGDPLKVREWRIIVLLATCGPLANTEIAELAGMNAATISRAVTLLADRGYVVTRADPQDKRKTLMSLTPAGAKLFNAISPARMKFLQELESCLTPEELETFYSVLDKFEHQLARVSEAAIQDVDWDA